MLGKKFVLTICGAALVVGVVSICSSMGHLQAPHRGYQARELQAANDSTSSPATTVQPATTLRHRTKDEQDPTAVRQHLRQQANVTQQVLQAQQEAVVLLQAQQGRLAQLQAAIEQLRDSRPAQPSQHVEELQDVVQSMEEGLALAEKDSSLAPATATVLKAFSSASATPVRMRLDSLLSRLRTHIAELRTRTQTQGDHGGRRGDGALHAGLEKVGLTQARMMADLSVQWPCNWKVLIRMLRIIVDKFNKQGISYFLAAGTAAAAHRHNDRFIWWETDVDVAVMEEHADRAEKLLLQIGRENPLLFKPVKFHRADGKGAWKEGEAYGLARMYSNPEGKLHNMHVDIAIYRFDTKLNGFVPKKANAGRPAKRESVEPIARCSFMGLDTYCPANIPAYLRDRYGFVAAKRRAGHKPWVPTALERKVFCNGEPDPALPVRW